MRSALIVFIPCKLAKIHKMDDYVIESKEYVSKSCSTTVIESDTENELEYIYAALDVLNISAEEKSQKNSTTIDIRFCATVILVSSALEKVCAGKAPIEHQITVLEQIIQTSASAETHINTSDSVTCEVNFWNELVVLLWKVLMLIFKW